MKYDFDCVIVGSGIAGMTAAIYLKRAKANILILDYDAPGGILNKVNIIENYPGFKSISGPDLAFKVYEQINNLNIEIRYGKVLNIKDHTILTDIEKITANKIILAIGRKSKKLDINTNFKNISYCSLCDGNLYKNKEIALIGNNKSIDDLIYLSNIVKKIYYFTKDKEISNRILEIPNIIIINDPIKDLIIEENTVKAIEINNKKINIDGIFVSLGYEPQSNFLDDIEKDNGYIIVNSKMETNIPYIYACGDIIKKEIYQITTAVSEATIAAVNVKKEI